MTHEPLQAAYPELHVTPQMPFVQVGAPFAGALQTVPHAPQLLGSVPTLTQELLHAVRPVPQLFTQDPLLHAYPDWHLIPHPPQLLESTNSLTHEPKQLLYPTLQLTLHLPPPQVPVPFAGELQIFPHVPQLATSFDRLKHCPLQFVCFFGHAVVQTPPTHAPPDGQAFPHAPQLLGSVCSLTHEPLQYV